MQLPKTLRPFENKIDSIADERRRVGRLFIDLKPGWKVGRDSHIVVAFDLNAAAALLGSAKRCNCKMCKS